MNKFIGLCSNVNYWPSVMYELGYRVRLVEQKISTKTDGVTPDVVAVSNRLMHSVVVDCKSGNNIDHDQDNRYKNIKAEHLLNWIDIREKSRLTLSACYSVNDSNYDDLRGHTDLPFVVFGSEFVEGKGDFGHDDLNRSLCKQTSLSNMTEPVQFYPFSACDDDPLILLYIMTGILAWVRKSRPKSLSDLTTHEALTDLLKTAHPKYKYMGEKHRNDLRSRVKKTLGTVLERDELKSIKDKSLEGRLSPATLQKFLEQCEEIIEERKVQTTLD